MNIEKIGIASDHAGFEIKEVVKHFLDEWLIEAEIFDYGTYSDERCDYPDYAHKLGNAIDTGEVEWGVIVCGSGNGIAMAANKHANVRAGLAWNQEQAKLTRQHNNANVLSLLVGLSHQMRRKQSPVHSSRQSLRVADTLSVSPRYLYMIN